jgi:hypothetical protein
VVLPRQGVFSLSAGVGVHAIVDQRLAIVGAVAHNSVQTDLVDVGAQRLLEGGSRGHCALRSQPQKSLGKKSWGQVFRFKPYPQGPTGFCGVG